VHAVLFDIDGTLLESAEADDALYRRSVRDVLGAVDLRPELHDYDRVTDSGILEQILADNAIAPDPAVVAAVKSRFVAALQAFIAANGPLREVPGAPRYLRSLAGTGRHGIALATGGWSETAKLKLDTAGFETAAFPLATSDDAHDREAIMRIALSRLGDGIETITYFGDGPWDAAATSALGWNFVPVGPQLGGITSFRDLELP